MDGWCLRPPDFDETKKYPVLFHVYGEPAGQIVRDRVGPASGRFRVHGVEDAVRFVGGIEDERDQPSRVPDAVVEPGEYRLEIDIRRERLVAPILEGKAD